MLRQITHETLFFTDGKETLVKLYTSCFTAGALITSWNLAPVRISIGHPRYGLKYQLAGVCKLLMPTRPMLALGIDSYRVKYEAILDGHGLAKIQAELEAVSKTADGKDLVLLCFESLAKPGEWCHRRMFAAWWERRTGEVVAELGELASRSTFKATPAVPGGRITQETLFPNIAGSRETR